MSSSVAQPTAASSATPRALNARPKTPSHGRRPSVSGPTNDMFIHTGTPSALPVAQAATLTALQTPGANQGPRSAHTFDTQALVERLLAGQENAVEVYRGLPAASCDELLGAWQGFEVSKDHPLSGLLPAFGWHGKRFESADAVHPLVFDAVGGGTFSVNPGWVPMRIGAYVPRWTVGKWLMTALRPIVSTSKPKARLREIKHEGVVSAAMIYDQLPIIDTFRKIDANTLLGAMDYREQPTPFYFLLQRQ